MLYKLVDNAVLLGICVIVSLLALPGTWLPLLEIPEGSWVGTTTLELKNLKGY